MNTYKKLTSVILSITLILGILFTVPITQTTAASTKAVVKLSAQCKYDYAYEVLDQVNELRSAKGLSKLKMDKTTLSYAMQRAAEIAIKYDHTRPDGSYCLDMDEKLVAENIANIYTSPDGVMDGWVNSSKHYANIMTTKSKSMGVGVVVHNGVYYWVQMFSSATATTITTPENTTKQFSINLGSNTYTLNLSIGSKIYRTDNKDIQIIGKNSDSNLEFVLDNDTFTFSSSDASTISFNSSTAIAHKTGSATLTAKSSAATITKKVTVAEFGAGKSKKCGDNITWDYNNGILTLDGSGKMYDYTTEYNSSGVTSTNTPWPDAFESVEKVIVTDGITYVGNSAFTGFKNLCEVMLPISITQIGNDVFAHCSSLESIVFPDSVVTIGNNTFTKCLNLTDVKLSGNLKAIPPYMFSSCSSLEYISIPDTVESIGQSAFAYCTKLKNPTLPKNLEQIDSLAFLGCDTITSMTIPYGVNSIGNKAFYDCKALKTVSLLDPTTIIGLEDVFTNTASSLNVKGYKNSSAEIFCKNNGIRFSAITADKAVISAENLSVTYTGKPVTENIKVNVQNAHENYIVKYSRGKNFDYNASFDSIEKLGEYWRENAPYDDRIKDYLIISNVYPISYCVYFEGSEPAFGLANITINQAVKSFAFEKDVIEIPWYTKGDNSTGFTNTLHGTDGIAITDIKFTTDNTSLIAIDYKGKIFPKRYGECTITATFNGNENYPSSSASYTLKIYPVGELVVGNYSCEFMENKTAVLNRYSGKDKVVDIPSEIAGTPLTTIKSKAFYSGAYEEINIPQGVTEICNNAFTSCYMLNTLTISDTVTTIGDRAFNGCKRLLSVTIPASVTHIGVEAFGYTNPDVDKVTKKIDGFVIYVYRNSAAEKYAIDNGFEFVALDKPEFELGDVDRDGKISILDATTIQMYKAQLCELDEEQIDLADFLSDGSVNILDATTIQLTLAGLI